LELDRLQDDIKKANLENKIKFLPPSSEMTCFYQSLDIFLLTSREDPYPLVVLEAANASVPVICFKNAGGSPEFIEKSNGGICVDYLDLEAMGNAVIHYYNNNSEREKAGSNAKKRLKVMHQNPEFIINLFESIIGKTAYKA
jgi:glycosyltransferase involved in cell wall biosynthesis